MSHRSTNKTRRSEDCITPNLKKANLIKVSKTPNSAPATSLKAPYTRSSEAVDNALKQKSLRNRGVHPIENHQMPKNLNLNSSSTVNSKKHIRLDKNAKRILQNVPGAESSTIKKQTSNTETPKINMLHSMRNRGAHSEPIGVKSKAQSPSNSTCAVVKRRVPPKLTDGKMNKSESIGKKKNIQSPTRTPKRPSSSSAIISASSSNSGTPLNKSSHKKIPSKHR